MRGQLVPLYDPQRRAGARALQCGLCHLAGADYGLRYRLFAGPDMVFYNAWLHLCGEPDPRLTRRACVLAPKVSRLPCAERGPATELAAAVGVWLGWAKLRDDADDEGGWLRTFAASAFAEGSQKARALLLERGFPVLEIETQLREQARIESLPELPFEDAAVPTVTIASLVFGHAGSPYAAAVGAEIGRFLYYLDNVEDYEQDVREGKYNALARGAASRELALRRARQTVARLKALLAPLPDSPWKDLVHSALVDRFQLRVRQLQGDLAPTPLWKTLWSRIGPRVQRSGARALARAQLWAMFALAWAWPTMARAGTGWWPAAATPEALELEGEPPPTMPAPEDGQYSLFGDLSRDGDFDFWDCCCVSDDCACVTACDNACDAACDDACSDVTCA